MTGKEKIKHFVLNLAALGIGCMVALVLLEVGLRIFSPIESRLRGDEIVLPANKKYILQLYVYDVACNYERSVENGLDPIPLQPGGEQARKRREHQEFDAA